MVARRLPPKVVGHSHKNRKEAPSGRRFRNALWVFPTLVCIVFAVLIAGVVGVRQAIVLVQERDNDNAHAATAGSVEQSLDFNDASGEPSEAVDATASLESSESGLEVLPPLAATQPGRTLPKMLIVGRRAEMFSTLESALELAVPGDVIEIRQNRPLTVEAVKLDVENRVPGAPPLTVRAGRGFRPVLKRSTASALVELLNVDVNIAGLNFADISLQCRDGDVHVEHCTWTGGLLSLENSDDRTRLLHLDVDRCFFRNRSYVNVTGPMVNVAIRETGIVGCQPFITFSADESQSLTIQRTTLLNTYLIELRVKDEWPEVPLAFRMDQSVFGILACCPHLVDVIPPASFTPNETADIAAALIRSFAEFKAGNNIAQFWEWWAAVGQQQISEHIVPELPLHDQTLRFGEKVEQARMLIHQEGDTPAAMQLLSTVVPADLVYTTDGPYAERVNAGERYGCNTTQLPVPPATTFDNR